jgi:hypothetical protein
MISSDFFLKKVPLMGDQALPNHLMLSQDTTTRHRSTQHPRLIADGRNTVGCPALNWLEG